MVPTEFDPSTTSSSLLSSLSSLEESIAPLLSKPWEETLDSLGTLERTKMNVLMAYAINDLIWGRPSSCILLAWRIAHG
jgi:exosome complex protein LRP1